MRVSLWSSRLLPLTITQLRTITQRSVTASMNMIELPAGARFGKRRRTIAVLNRAVQRNIVVEPAMDRWCVSCDCRAAIGHILDESFVIEDIFRPCRAFGLCNPCDIKVKTNRFQQYGHTSVEIEMPAERARQE